MAEPGIIWAQQNIEDGRAKNFCSFSGALQDTGVDSRGSFQADAPPTTIVKNWRKFSSVSSCRERLINKMASAVPMSCVQRASIFDQMGRRGFFQTNWVRRFRSLSNVPCNTVDMKQNSRENTTHGPRPVKCSPDRVRMAIDLGRLDNPARLLRPAIRDHRSSWTVIKLKSTNTLEPGKKLSSAPCQAGGAQRQQTSSVGRSMYLFESFLKMQWPFSSAFCINLLQIGKPCLRFLSEISRDWAGQWQRISISSSGLSCLHSVPPK